MARANKIASLIKQELSMVIMKIDDLKNSGVWAISDVMMSDDLGYAKIYIRILDVNKSKDIISKLNNLVPYCRSQIAKSVSLKKVPKISFVHDKSLEEANRIYKLISDADGES